ncbi:MAG TPA: hypothetical protein VMR51_00575 [Patescibacteria group bacterium]|jgi:hypothetical protein|nr:hypothetical protein [Patescibacteria group bacterium]
MNAPVLLGIVAVVFGAMPLLLGSNAVYILLTLCAGDLLATLAAKDVTQIINSIVTVNVPLYSYVQIFLLVIAPLIVLLIYRKSIGAGRILQIIPAAAAVLICFMLVTAMLPSNMQNNIQNSHLYSLLNPFFEFAIAAGLLVSVFYLWTKRTRNHKPGRKHHAL